MRTFIFISTLVAAFYTADASRSLHSIPEDTYAFPKFQVTFLNSLPVINETAERWLKEGLRGGELEFLDQTWKEDNRPSHSSRKEIGQSPSDDTSITDVHSSFLLALDHAQRLPWCRHHLQWSPITPWNT
jgi:hypothetical protein